MSESTATHDPRPSLVAAVKPLVPKAKVVKGTSYDRLQLDGKTLAYLNAPRTRKPGATAHILVGLDDLTAELRAQVTATVQGRYSEFVVVDDPAPAAEAISLAAKAMAARIAARDAKASTKPEPKPKKAASGDAPEPVEQLPAPTVEKTIEVTPDPKPTPKKKSGKGKGATKTAASGTKKTTDSGARKRRPSKAQALVESGLATDLKDARAQLADMGEGS